MEDFSSLASLVSLNELDLSKCVEITDIGVRELASLKSLPILSSTIIARSQTKFVALWWVQIFLDVILHVGVETLLPLTCLITLIFGNCRRITSYGFGLLELDDVKDLVYLEC